MSRYWFALIGALILLSCSNSVDSDLDYAVYNYNPRAHRLLDTEEPDMAIDLLEYAYGHLNPGLYGSLLHSDFRYEFTPEDADSAGLPPDEPWWGKVPDVQSTQALFEDPRLISLSLDLERVSPWARHVDSVTGLEGRLAQFEPYIMVTIALDPEPVIFLIYDSVLDISLVPVGHGEPADWGVLFIKESTDLSSGGSALTEPFTWGKLKIMYR